MEFVEDIRPLGRINLLNREKNNFHDPALYQHAPEATGKRRRVS
jgi:hypothetical protein